MKKTTWSKVPDYLADDIFGDSLEEYKEEEETIIINGKKYSNDPPVEKIKKRKSFDE